jgi:hypothetical protein
MHMTIHDISGKFIWGFSGQANEIKMINLASLPAGVYILGVSLPDARVAIRRKFVK